MSLDEAYAAARASLWDELVIHKHDRLGSYVPSLIKGFSAFQVASHQKPPARSRRTKEACYTRRPFIENEKIGIYSKETHPSTWTLPVERLDILKSSARRFKTPETSNAVAF